MNSSIILPKDCVELIMYQDVNVFRTLATTCKAYKIKLNLERICKTLLKPAGGRRGMLRPHVFQKKLYVFQDYLFLYYESFDGRTCARYVEMENLSVMVRKGKGAEYFERPPLVENGRIKF